MPPKDFIWSNLLQILLRNPYLFISSFIYSFILNWNRPAGVCTLEVCFSRHRIPRGSVQTRYRPETAALCDSVVHKGLVYTSSSSSSPSYLAYTTDHFSPPFAFASSSIRLRFAFDTHRRPMFLARNSSSCALITNRDFVTTIFPQFRPRCTTSELLS